MTRQEEYILHRINEQSHEWFAHETSSYNYDRLLNLIKAIKYNYQLLENMKKTGHLNMNKLEIHKNRMDIYMQKVENIDCILKENNYNYNPKRIEIIKKTINKLKYYENKKNSRRLQPYKG